MMFHFRQMLVVSVIVMAIAACILEGIRPVDAKLPVDVDYAGVKEMSPQEFERHHVQRFQRLPPVENNTRQ